MHTTNATDTFVTVAPDTRATAGSEPPVRATPSVATLCFEMLADAPYIHTSDDVLFAVYAQRKGLDPDDADARAAYFSKGQPCFRASPLTKTYGWGVHHDSQGRVALVAMESAAYRTFAAGLDPHGRELRVVAAMRARR